MTEYEFNENQNEIIQTLSSRMYIGSIALFISGVLTLIIGFIDPQIKLNYIITGLAIISVGVAQYFPVDNFKRIVTTSGKDITELLTGFKELDKGFNFVLVTVFIYLVNSIVQFIIAL